MGETKLIMAKNPYMYSLLGTKKYKNTIKSDNPDGYAKRCYYARH